ncbi:MAG: hypothetical protein OXB86_04775 [Bdellovibrionales bacterium]|nr:hypothetical protein [Bdellovibrionales bacterium]
MTKKKKTGHDFDAVLNNKKKPTTKRETDLSQSQNDRVAFVINKNTLEKVRAFTWYNRVKLKDFLNSAIEDKLEKEGDSLKKALREYRKLT